MASILYKHEIELLVNTRSLLEEIPETLEISSDPQTSKAIKEGLKDMKAGRVRPYREFAAGNKYIHVRARNRDHGPQDPHNLGRGV
jgi:hypothetical protein